MSLLDYFKRSKPSASIARERLQILVAHERASITQAAYLPQLKQELLAVIQKYFNVDEESVSVNLEQDGNNEILELNVVFPDEEAHKNQTEAKKGKYNVRVNRTGRR
ncbi:MAG: cell division topological specificity factor MinE [Methylococcales bacterium]|nr:cell division topological specificity factor MinE [Methylococcales bacterium]